MAVAGLIAVVVLTAGAAGLFATGRGSRRPAGAVLPAAMWRRSAAWRWGGIATGGLVACAAALSGALGRGMLLAAPLFGLFVLLGVLCAELSVRAPTATARQATIKIRRSRDYLPRRPAEAVMMATGVLTALLVVTTATGTADDMGRAGRALARQCTPASSQAHTPWAGSYYSYPLAAILAAGLVAAAFTVRAVVMRPRPGDPAVVTIADDLLRRRAGYTVTGAIGVLVSIPLIALSLVTSAALLSISCRPVWWTVAAWSLIALAPAWVALLAWSGLAVVFPSRAAAQPAR